MESKTLTAGETPTVVAAGPWIIRYGSKFSPLLRSNRVKGDHTGMVKVELIPRNGKLEFLKTSFLSGTRISDLLIKEGILLQLSNLDCQRRESFVVFGPNMWIDIENSGSNNGVRVKHGDVNVDHDDGGLHDSKIQSPTIDSHGAPPTMWHCLIFLLTL
ncbi:hypothetical protein V6N13_051721 [Hibiscus sabdariffa]|uniref:Uncharacterized protein n=1 Tax=Hibiscus sabdariffa TaxID=183260 RepID=A0ABR2T569_9ROSI